jgi:hypothetical protein
MNTLQQSSSNNIHKRKKIRGWISQFSWLLFLKGTISFHGLGWEVKLQYQPFLENKIFPELVESLNLADESIK